MACPFSGNGGNPNKDEGAPAGLYYHEYLQLDKILDAQLPLSKTDTSPAAHEEHLFIVIHQVYEIWFKHILHEIDSVLDIFASDFVKHQQLAVVVSRLDRVAQILKVLIQQVEVLETMTPHQFLEFRDVLFPASGFQSVQFRLLEIKLGLPSSRRLTYGGTNYGAFLSTRHRDLLQNIESQPSLFDLVEKWLERTPGTADNASFNFWQMYRSSVANMCSTDRKFINDNANLEDADRKQMLEAVDSREAMFESLFDAEKYKQRQENGYCRLSHQAVKGALLISVYQHEPLMHFPYQLLTKIQQIDEGLTTWRYRHAQMVHRMLGDKVGTGGSSGYRYLQAAASRHKIFADLFNLSTFLIPTTHLPPIPENLRNLYSLKFEETATTPSSK